MSHFTDCNGHLQAYECDVHADRQVRRMKGIAVVSHTQAQKNQLREFLSKDLKHVVLVRVADDTNVWIQGTLGEEKSKAKAKRVASALGVCQRIAVREVLNVQDGRTLCKEASINVPYQVLPQANAATIRDRLQKWSLLSSAGCSVHLGGDSVLSELKRIPMKVIISCVDSLQANMTVLGAEQHAWEQKRQAGDRLASTTAEINIPCFQHQCCLAKKPGILAVEGLASGLVRMAHCMRASTFSQRFEKFRSHLEGRVERRCVPSLSPQMLQVPGPS